MRTLTRVASKQRESQLHGPTSSSRVVVTKAQGAQPSLTVTVIALFFSGCFPPFTTPPNTLYGPAYDSPTRPDNFAVIEFDATGELLCGECQFDPLIEDLASPSTTEGLLTVIFIHGWRNTANPHPGSKHNSNLKGFLRIINQLQTIEDGRAKDGLEGRNVLGVFVGWRGTTIKGRSKVNSWVDFHNRKRAAERVASGPLSRVLYRICSETQKKARSSRCVVIGHSLGGLIVERSVGEVQRASVVASGYAAGSGQAATATPFDLVVALNPANEARWAKLFIETLKESPVPIDQESPLFVSITSATDDVTRDKFRGSRRWWSTLKKRGSARYCGQPGQQDKNGKLDEERPLEGKICQKELLESTAGHVSQLRSHRISFNELPKTTDCEEAPFCAEYDRCFRWKSTSGRCFEYEITRDSEKPWNDTAYWLVWDQEGKLISGHSDIFTDELLGLLWSLVQGYEHEKERDQDP